MLDDSLALYSIVNNKMVVLRKACRVYALYAKSIGEIWLGVLSFEIVKIFMDIFLSVFFLGNIRIVDLSNYFVFRL